jgi:hypothetical protein
MKRLSLYLFLILFTLPTPSQANDIRDFQIEGMSVGDSLLDYMSKLEVDNSKAFFYPKSKKFKEISVNKELSIYNMLTASIKVSDKKYIIYSMMADLFFRNNFEDCLKKKDEVLADIKNTLGSFEKIKDSHYKRSLDKSGKSYDKSTTIYFNNGDNIRIICTNWADAMNLTDRLTVAINTKEFYDWMLNEAY